MLTFNTRMVADVQLYHYKFTRKCLFLAVQYSDIFAWKG